MTTAVLEPILADMRMIDLDTEANVRLRAEYKDFCARPLYRFGFEAEMNFEVGMNPLQTRETLKAQLAGMMSPPIHFIRTIGGVKKIWVAFLPTVEQNGDIESKKFKVKAEISFR